MADEVMYKYVRGKGWVFDRDDEHKYGFWGIDYSRLEMDIINTYSNWSTSSLQESIRAQVEASGQYVPGTVEVTADNRGNVVVSGVSLGTIPAITITGTITVD